MTIEKMAELTSRMDVEDSNFPCSNTDQGLHDSFSTFLHSVNLDGHWPLEGEYDMHICLKCLTNITGLSKYLIHKLKECPKLSFEQPKTSVPSEKPEIVTESTVEPDSASVLDTQHQELINPAEIDIGTCHETAELENEIDKILKDDDSSCSKYGDDNISKKPVIQSKDNESGIHTSLRKRRLKRTPLKSLKPSCMPQKLKPFYCEPCGLTCASKKSLVYHLASPEHWRASSKHPIHNNLILAHSEELAPLAPYKCSICSFYFNKLEDLANHCVTESEAHKKNLGQYRQLLCNKCSFQCWTGEELLNHFNCDVHKQKTPQNPVVVSGSEDFFCTRCKWTCKRKHALLFHIKLKHAGELHCKECQITFDDEDELNRHILETEHDNDLFNCALCPFVGKSKLNFQDHLKRGHIKCEPKTVSGVKRKVETDVENASGKLEKDDYASIVHQFMQTMGKSPQNAILQIQKMETAEDAACASQKGNGSPGPLTFVKFDASRKAENKEPFVIFVVDSAKEGDSNASPLIVDDKGVDAGMKNSEQETTPEKLATSEKQKETRKFCNHCRQKCENQKALRVHIKTNHPEKMFHCEPCFATFCSEAKLESHTKGRLHACNTKDARDIEKGYLKPTSDFSCKYCNFRTATKAGILFHEVMHTSNSNQAGVGDALKADVSENNESEKALCEDMSEDVTEEGKENVEGLSLGLPIKVTDEDVFIAHEDVEDDIYVHVMEDTNEVEVTTSKDSEQNGELEPTTDKDVGDLTSSESATANDKPDKSVKSLKLYSCPICQEPLTATQLRFHLIGHTGEQLFTCSICSSSYSRKASLVSHMRDQHEAKKYNCQNCSFRTNRKIKLNEHLLTHDTDNRVREFPCETCGSKFYTSSAVQTHMLIHTENKGRTVLCTFEGCTKAFRYTSEMLYHKRVHSMDANYLCELCGFATKSQQLLRKHERSHDDVKKYQCKYCSYAATHSYHLNRHMRIHCNTKPYSCPHCPFTCNSQENLRKHILNSKKHTGLNVYPCRHCDFGCNVADEMRMHTIREHVEIAQMYDEDNPAFASLVAGIFNPEFDTKVPSEQPAPYVPVKERIKRSKNARSAAKKSKKNLTIHNSGDGIDWLRKQGTDAVEDNSIDKVEVDIAVDNLVEMTKWDLEATGIVVSSVAIESNVENNVNSEPKCHDVILSENVQHYQFFDDSDISQMDVQEVTIWAAPDL